MTKTHWSNMQIKEFARQLKRDPVFGAAAFMCSEVREALVDQKILSIVRLQNAESVEVAAIDELSNRLHTAVLGERGPR